jgi:hypothetical protein
VGGFDNQKQTNEQIIASHIFHRTLYERVRETTTKAQQKLEKLDPFNRWFKNKTSYHLQESEPSTSKNRWPKQNINSLAAEKENGEREFFAARAPSRREHEHHTKTNKNQR